MKPQAVWEMGLNLGLMPLCRLAGTWGGGTPESLVAEPPHWWGVFWSSGSQLPADRLKAVCTKLGLTILTRMEPGAGETQGLQKALGSLLLPQEGVSGASMRLQRDEADPQLADSAP